MFGFFAPRLPVTPEQKVWVDRRMDWLVGEFGESRGSVTSSPRFSPFSIRLHSAQNWRISCSDGREKPSRCGIGMAQCCF